VRALWVFAHLLGFVMWLGAALSAMAIGITARREPRENLAVVARQLAVVYRLVMMPGALLTVASGLVLTLMVYGGPGTTLTVSHWLMAMQGTGLVGAVLVLVSVVPAASRAAAIDPTGPRGAVFDALRARTARIGMLASSLGFVALVTGAMMSVGG
jgi:hypothetical protein